ncbi:hypothetical protein ISN44_As07g008020 [Arabidopsis suecica]|uniref:Embryo surrounding factor 1 brassicaceae domain-containing protein n=1 Tax=Arabidopsis suecica TaxID=45249 RepID=A0A8T2BQ27_ARASU|nr:hypothetical protein ISN44_As07g008020 [Arabidopsis suecica]
MSIMIKITMIMALVIMDVRAKTVTECQKTDCKCLCQNMTDIACTNCLFRCTSPPSFKYSNTRPNQLKMTPKICYYICSGGCGTDKRCDHRCKTCCGWPSLEASSSLI